MAIHSYSTAPFNKDCDNKLCHKVIIVSNDRQGNNIFVNNIPCRFTPVLRLMYTGVWHLKTLKNKQNEKSS